MTLEQRAEKLYGDLLAQIGKGGSPVQLRLLAEPQQKRPGQGIPGANDRDGIRRAAAVFQGSPNRHIGAAGGQFRTAQSCGDVMPFTRARSRRRVIVQ